MKDIQELREQRDDLAAEVHSLLDKTEGKKWTDADQKLYDGYMEKIEAINRDMKVIYDMQQALADEHDIRLGNWKSTETDKSNCVAVYKDAKNGHQIPVLGAQHRLAAHASNQPTNEEVNNYTIGDVILAKAAGTRDIILLNALEEGTDSAGGYAVPKKLAAETWDLARDKMQCMKAGVRTIQLDTHQTTFAGIASDPVAGWRLEKGAVTESDPTFKGVVMTPKSLAVKFDFSLELSQDSPNLVEMLNNAVSQAMANTVDSAILFGSGTNPEPRGILNTTNVNEYDMGTNGAALSGYSDVLAAYQQMAEDNSAEATGLIMSPRECFAFAGMTDTTGQPLRKPDLLEDIPFLMTSKIPVDGTHGTAENAANIYLGDFTRAVLGVRQELIIEVLKGSTYGSNLMFTLLAHLRADIALSHPGHFTVIKGVIPAA